MIELKEGKPQRIILQLTNQGEPYDGEASFRVVYNYKKKDEKVVFDKTSDVVDGKLTLDFPSFKDNDYIYLIETEEGHTEPDEFHIFRSLLNKEPKESQLNIELDQDFGLNKDVLGEKAQEFFDKNAGRLKQTEKLLEERKREREDGEKSILKVLEETKKEHLSQMGEFHLNIQEQIVNLSDEIEEEELERQKGDDAVVSLVKVEVGSLDNKINSLETAYISADKSLEKRLNVKTDKLSSDITNVSKKLEGKIPKGGILDFTVDDEKVAKNILWSSVKITDVLRGLRTNNQGFHYTTDINDSQSSAETTYSSEYIDANFGGSGGAWGSITGTLSDQTDLQTALDAKLENIVEDTTPQLGGSLDTNGNTITFADNIKALFGTGSDASMYYNGSNLYINPKEVGTGLLNVRSAISGEDIRLGSAGFSIYTQQYPDDIGASSAFFMTYDGAGNTIQSDADYLNFDTGSGAYYQFLTGNVGIGTTVAPNNKLDIQSTGEAAIAITSTGVNTDPLIKFELANNTPLFTVGIDDSDSDKFKIAGSALGTNDKLIIDSSGNVTLPILDTDLAAPTTTGTTKMVITDANGQLSFDNIPSSGGITRTEVTGTTQAGAVNTGYIANNAGLVTITLPDTAPVGSILRVVGKGAGGWRIAQNASEQIIRNEGGVDGTDETTIGVAGHIDSTDDYDAVELICITADTTWTVLSSKGIIALT